EQLDDVVSFADGIFNKLHPTIIESIRQYINEMEFLAEGAEYQEIEIDQVEIKDIKLTSSSLTDVTQESAIYDLSAMVT
ncbi:hypothetical protein QIH29_27200, partial [Klebsiella pneumoniae]|nr:hypothetical protein [Klebsiella pneumoniae]